MTVTCESTATEYIFTATEGTNTLEYRYPKMVNGKPLDLQQYKKEVTLLANLEVQKLQPPIPVTL